MPNITVTKKIIINYNCTGEIGIDFDEHEIRNQPGVVGVYMYVCSLITPSFTA